MNRLSGRVVAFRTHQGVSLVECQTASGLLGAVILETETSAPWIAPQKDIALWFKETEVWPLPTSLDIPSPYFLEGTLQAVQVGKILSRLDFSTADGPVRALVDCAWADALRRTPDEKFRLRLHPAAIALREPGSEEA